MVYDEKERKEYATVGKDRYPINDKSHAKAALARLNQGGLSPEEKMEVIRKAHAMLSKGKKTNPRKYIIKKRKKRRKRKNNGYSF